MTATFSSSPRDAVFAVPNLVAVPCLDEDDDDDDLEEESSSLHSSSSSSSSSSSFAACDELYALNTALCYLCSINAHAKHVEFFLFMHPQALVMEGTGYLLEESARAIVQEQVRQTQVGQFVVACGDHFPCYSPYCQDNRRQSLACLEKGFEHYHSHGHRKAEPSPRKATKASEASKPTMSFSWPLYRAQLVSMERKVRVLRRQELSLRQLLLERSVRVRTCQDEMRKLITNHESAKAVSSSPSPLQIPPNHNNKSCWGRATNTLFACGHSHRRRRYHQYTSDCASSSLSAAHVVNDFMDKQSMLEYQSDLATIHLSTVQREYNNLLQDIRLLRKRQFALLSKAFHGVERYTCVAAVGKNNNNNITKHYSNKSPATNQQFDANNKPSEDGYNTQTATMTR